MDRASSGEAGWNEEWCVSVAAHCLLFTCWKNEVWERVKTQPSSLRRKKNWPGENKAACLLRPHPLGVRGHAPHTDPLSLSREKGRRARLV
jgi:hypothetical protein